MRDQRGYLWIASAGGGLIKWDEERNQAEQFDSTSSLGSDTVFVLEPSRRGGFYAATWGAGLAYDDPKTDRFHRWTASECGLPSDHRAVHEDANDVDTVWVGMGAAGFGRFNIQTGDGFAYQSGPEDPETLSSDDVTSVYEDPQGNFWLGTFGAGINFFDRKTGKVKRFTADDGLPASNTVWGILPGPDRHLWISTESGGLFRYSLADGSSRASVKKMGRFRSLRKLVTTRQAQASCSSVDPRASLSSIQRPLPTTATRPR